MNKNITIIGHFGGYMQLYDGQTVKTKILYEELKKTTSWNIRIIDTFWKDKKPLLLLAKTLFALIRNDVIIVLLSGNGMRLLFPLLSFFASRMNRRIFHDVIGGNLHCYVDQYPQFIKYLNSFTRNWVETETLKRELESRSILNCTVVPNFKPLIVQESSYPIDENVFRFCTFSRVMKEKGIELAIKAIESINKEVGYNICELHIYGPIDPNYFEDFNRIMLEASDSIAYKGIVPFDKSVEIIKNYYALLFPTFWQGEGFPGTIVDAYCASLPVIASNWNSNSELIVNYETGILYPDNSLVSLTNAIKWSIHNPAKMLEMRRACFNKASDYLPTTNISKIINDIELYGLRFHQK